VRICPACGHENRDSAKFCQECAAKLTPAPSAHEQRKTVTVLFCDLVGSTGIGERTDPEVLHELMAGYHSRLRWILERHGATVEKFIGDAAMAVFGLPQAHEDDALRAVRAADEIQQAVGRLELEVRIGINTGEVVAGEGETLVTGDAVNVAARLEQAARPGEVLFGEATERLVREAVRSESLRPLALKGKAAPVPAYRLHELLADVPAFTRPIDAPFVGRERDLETLRHALAAAIEERQPQLATIVGAPGIGKSRLARELSRRADARVLVGRCLSYGEGITYWPLAEILPQVGDLASVLDDELAADRICAALGAGESTAEEIAWGFRRLFETLAQERPLIVVLDDIHWAEPALLDLIEYVATFAQKAPLLLLCIARPDLYEQRPAWTTPRPNATLVTLEPLPRAEAEALVEELRDVPAQTKARIVAAAEGNPLFVEQLVAMQDQARNGELEIPPTIQALLAARVDGLDPEERAVIERASIEGRVFHRGSVAELAPESVRPRVGSHLITLVRKEFIRPDRATLSGDDGFRFAHALIRDAAYDSLPKRLRAELHERFAGWLESKLGDEAPGEILGYHLEQACRYRTELGWDDEQTHELELRAGRLLAEAGRRARTRGDVVATRSLLERATELLPDEDRERPSLLAILGNSTFEAGDVPRALELLRRAQRAAAASGQRNIELRARMSELRFRVTTAPDQDAGAALGEAKAAIRELKRQDDLASLIAAWCLIFWVGMLRTDNALIEEAAGHWFELARQAGLRHEAVSAAGGLVLSLTQGLTPAEEAIVRAEQVLAEFPDEGSGEGYLALLYAFAGRDAEAEQTIERNRRASIELGRRTQHASSSMYLGWIALLAGRPERAEPALREGADVLEAAGERGWLAGVAGVLAEVLYRLGIYEEAAAWSRRTERASLPQDFMAQAMWRSPRAKVLARRGEAEQAIRLSSEAVEQARRTDAPHILGDCLFDRAVVLRLLDRADEARPVLEEALAVYEHKGIVPSVERTRALLAEITV
jgi:class 3 adenylate cyclase/tetratricopeptide (TPR) repeat protein